MGKRSCRLWVGACLFILSPGGRSWAAWTEPTPSTGETTITSDEMELIHNGGETILTGHVILIRPPYQMKADRMIRYKETGIVEAEGNVIGTWDKPTGERVEAVGAYARYTPQAQTTELWGAARLSHWDNATDPTPLIVTAERFVAHHDTEIVDGETHVFFRRGTSFQAHSDRAQFDGKGQVLNLWGTQQTDTLWADPRGSGRFLSDRVLLYLSPRRARLLDHVTSHVIPTPL